MKAKFYKEGFERRMNVIKFEEHYVHGITLDNGEYLAIPTSNCCFYDIDEKCIDWEQRRYEISKSMLEANLTNPDLMQCITSIDGDNKELLVKVAIKYADELIKQLKESAI